MTTTEEAADLDLEEWNQKGIRREIIAANTSEGSGDGVGREYT